MTISGSQRVGSAGAKRSAAAPAARASIADSASLGGKNGRAAAHNQFVQTNPNAILAVGASHHAVQFNFTPRKARRGTPVARRQSLA
jgi:hypothetical protein